MLSSGRVVFGEMDEVVFGKPAAEAVAQQAQRLGATRVFLMVTRLGGLAGEGPSQPNRPKLEAATPHVR